MSYEEQQEVSEETGKSQVEDYQVWAVNIKYDEYLGDQRVDLHSKRMPESAVLNVPESILKGKRNRQRFYENVETFVYNTLTRKCGAEVCFCQIFLPLDD